MAKITREDALEYHHLKGKPGKISVVPTKPMDTQRDLGLAYTPGVAEPVLEIEKDAELAYEYTSKGNLVAVISNGTAILGLGELIVTIILAQGWLGERLSTLQWLGAVLLATNLLLVGFDKFTPEKRLTSGLLSWLNPPKIPSTDIPWQSQP